MKNWELTGRQAETKLKNLWGWNEKCTGAESLQELQREQNSKVAELQNTERENALVGFSKRDIFDWVNYSIKVQISRLVLSVLILISKDITLHKGLVLISI